MSKRKRESSEAATPVEAQAQAGPSSSKSTPTTAKADRKGKGKEVALTEDGDGPMVHYSSADGQHWWSQRLNSQLDLQKTLKEVARSIGVPSDLAGDLTLSYLRDEGREADIWDGYDYAAFKARAMANPTMHLNLKVYTPASPKFHPVSSHPPSQSAPSSHATPVIRGKKGKGRQSLADVMRDASLAQAQVEQTSSPAATTVDSPSTLPKPISKKAKKANGHPPPTSSNPVERPTALASEAATMSTSATSAISMPLVEIKRNTQHPASTPRKNASKSFPQNEASTSTQPTQPAQATETGVPSKKAQKAKKSFMPATTTTSPSIASPVLSSNNPPASSVASDSAAPAHSAKADRKAKRAEKKKRKSEARRSSAIASPAAASSLPASPEAPSTPVTPSPHINGSHPAGRLVALNFADRYKPARPSPLGNNIATPASPAGNDSTEIPRPKEKKSRKRARRTSGMEQQLGAGAANANSVPPSADQKESGTAASNEDEDQGTKSSADESTRIQSPSQKKARQEEAQSENVEEPVADAARRTPVRPSARPYDETSDAIAPAPNDEPAECAPQQAASQDDVDMDAPEPTPSRSPAKKVVALSTEYDLLRRPKESSRDSSSISGEVQKTESATNASDTTSEADGSRSVSTQLDNETIDTAPPLEAEDAIASTSTDVPVTASTQADDVESTDLGASLSARVPGLPAEEGGSQAVSEPDSANEKEQILTPKSKPPRARRVTKPASASTPVTVDQVEKSTSADVGIEKMDLDTAPVKEAPHVNGANHRTQDVTTPTTDTTAGMLVESSGQPTASSRETEVTVNDTDSTPASDPSTSVPDSRSTATSNAVKTKVNKRGPKPKSKGPDPPCAICLQTPSHLQKDCPEVKAGPDNLRYLLSARKDQQESLGGDEDGSHFANSIELIEWWLHRTSKIANQVQGAETKEKENGFLPRSPLKVMGTKTGESIDLNAPTPKKAAQGRRKKAVTPSPPAPDVDEDIIMASPESTNITLAASKSATTPPKVNGHLASSPEPPADAQSVTSPDAQLPHLPPIHLRAMQKARRPGSLSGLSVSDAFIETEPSDESSTDDGSDASGDEEAQSQKGADSGDESSASSVVSSSSAISSSTNTTTASATSRVPLPANPSNAISFSLTRELSEREKKKARLSAAKMQPVSFDTESESALDDEDADVDEPSEPASPVKPRPAYVRADSDSSIGDFEDGDDASRRSSIDSTIHPPYLSQAPPIVASSSQPVGVDIDAEPNEDEVVPASSVAKSASPMLDRRFLSDEHISRAESKQSNTATSDEVETAQEDLRPGSRSFRALAGMAESSPDLDDSPGAQAVRRGIAEEESPEDLLPSQIQLGDEVEPPVPTQPSRRRRSTTVEVVIPSQRRRSSRTVTASPSKPTRQSIEPEGETRSLGPGSRKSVEPTPSASMRSTRSVSRSKASASPSISIKVLQSPNTPRVGLPGRALLPEIEEAESEQETPKVAPKKRGRPPRSSQATQLESSLPINEENSLPESSLPATQPVPEAQTQSTPIRQSKDASASPLFMTQGSQIPATQYYDPQPETIPEGDDSWRPPPTSETSPKKPRGRPKGSKSKVAVSPASQPAVKTSSQGTKQVKNGKKATNAKASQSKRTASQTTNIQKSASLPDPSPPRSPASPPSAQPHESDADASSSSSDNEDEDDAASIPDIAPPTIRHLPSSQPSSTTPIYPSLSSLSKDWLRRTTSFLGGMGSASQPHTPQGSGKVNGLSGAAESESDSGSGSDSSDDETKGVPSAIKSRFASGGMTKKRKSESQPAGW